MVGLEASSQVLTVDDVCRLAANGVGPSSGYRLKVDEVITTTNKDAPKVLSQSTTWFVYTNDAKIIVSDSQRGIDHIRSTSVASNATYYSLTTGTHQGKTITPELYIQLPRPRFFGTFDFVDKQLFCELLSQLRNPAVERSAANASEIMVSGDATEFRMTNRMTITISTEPKFRIESVHQVFPGQTVVDAQFIDGADAGSFWRYRQIVGLVQGASAFGESAYVMTKTPSAEESPNDFPAVSILEGLKRGMMIHDERESPASIYRYKGEILPLAKAKAEQERVATLRASVSAPNPRRWIVIVALALQPIIFASLWKLQRVAKPKSDGGDQQST